MTKQMSVAGCAIFHPSLLGMTNVIKFLMEALLVWDCCRHLLLNSLCRACQIGLDGAYHSVNEACGNLRSLIAFSGSDELDKSRGIFGSSWWMGIYRYRCGW